MAISEHGPWTIRVCRVHGPLSEPLSRRCHCGLGANVVEVIPSTTSRGAVDPPDLHERLAQECDRYGLPPNLDTLLRHIYNNHAATIGAKDDLIASLRKRGAVEERPDNNPHTTP